MNVTSETTKMPSGAHFVLVHGASHGAWCWYKIRRLLECAGHKVTCLDLRGSGTDPSDANTIFTFEEYNQPLEDVLSGLGEGEKVILVGHSAGGLSLVAAIRNYPMKINVAVFVAAVMFRNGFSELPLHNPKDSQIYDLVYEKGDDDLPTSVLVKKEFQRSLFFQRTPLEDITLAAMLLKPYPCRALRDARFPDVHGKEIDTVPRVYIKAMHDNVTPENSQDAMIKKWPPSDVYTIDSDHSPFFSNPFELFGLLLRVAATYGYKYNIPN
ncbi:hypothetical protein Cgig2_004888 [Carnegiea gigantea]|uniref:AB hydrolase-1 domain-containing protein n=1 Tax=Carnegiea gigantea TaxID=171969 RepID=A0A9Q1JKT5_9CARY|nr:hypothetical protein Cgig2_004888 [Carnegiea gigantea]